MIRICYIVAHTCSLLVHTLPCLMGDLDDSASGSTSDLDMVVLTLPSMMSIQYIFWDINFWNKRLVRDDHCVFVGSEVGPSTSDLDMVVLTLPSMMSIQYIFWDINFWNKRLVCDDHCVFVGSEVGPTGLNKWSNKNILYLNHKESLSVLVSVVAGLKPVHSKKQFFYCFLATLLSFFSFDATLLHAADFFCWGKIMQRSCLPLGARFLGTSEELGRSALGPRSREESSGNLAA
jgi:hypothetical protein